MHTRSHLRNTPSFTQPSVPAASCLHLIRHFQPVTRSKLVTGSGKSQPTVTRAVAALMEAKLVRERPDLSIPNGPGRPTIPIELSVSPWAQIGVAVGTKTTYVGAYSTRGVAIQEKILDIVPAQMSADQYAETLAIAIREIAELSELPLANVGIATSGHVNSLGLVTAKNLGWEGVDLAGRIYNRISAPVTVSSAITAIAGAEQQAQNPDAPANSLIFYADDSIGAALQNLQEVVILPLDENIHGSSSLGASAVALVEQTRPKVIVLAGSAFENSEDALAVGQELRKSPHGTKDKLEIRVIPTHLDNARAAARAIAMDRLIEDPLGLAKRLVTRRR
ncbi:ROK family protein [Corynebacterium ulcerans]|uniref:ROK family protein n=1 Tax=Corynebacterium ulcerans TaxID=65058 RepID=UPI0018D5FC65|nr:ROK family protein [Corynebacterium ulcerans]MBH5295317.1 ROK family protein [Corynebacterium ulcerans]MDK8888460.1 ROK family protein [Corynebacterium ulcerans]